MSGTRLSQGGVNEYVELDAMRETHTAFPLYMR